MTTEASTATSTQSKPCWEGKKYRMVSSDNFEGFLKAKGVNIIGRKMANSVTPTVAMSRDADGRVYTFHTWSVFKDSQSSFRLDEEFDEETPDGRTVRSIITMSADGTRMVHRQLGEKETRIERVFEAERAVVTMSYDGVVCTREYAVVEA